MIKRIRPVQCIKLMRLASDLPSVRGKKFKKKVCVKMNQIPSERRRKLNTANLSQFRSSDNR